MPTMDDQTFINYLLEPNIASLATIDDNGFPSITPMWYTFEDKDVWMLSARSSHKVKNIRSNPLVGLSISNDRHPYKYITIRGQAEICGDLDKERLIRICVKYDGITDGMKLADGFLSGNSVLIKLTISKSASWTENG